MSQQNTPNYFLTIAKERGVLKDRGNNADMECLVNCTLNTKAVNSYIHTLSFLTKRTNLKKLNNI